MFVSSEIDRGIFQAQFTGTVTSSDISQANTELVSRPEFSTIKLQLWYFKDIDEFDFDVHEVKEIADQDREASKTNPIMRIAICSSSPLVYGFSRVYKGYYSNGPWQIMVFTEIEEAKEWLFS